MIANNVLTQVDGQVPPRCSIVSLSHCFRATPMESSRQRARPSRVAAPSISVAMSPSNSEAQPSRSSRRARWEAHVEANELRQLGGILTVEVVVDGEPLVDIALPAL